MELAPAGIFPPDDDQRVGHDPAVERVEAALDAGHDEEALALAEAALGAGEGSRLDLLFLAGDALLPDQRTAAGVQTGRHAVVDHVQQIADQQLRGHRGNGAADGPSHVRPGDISPPTGADGNQLRSGKTRADIEQPVSVQGAHGGGVLRISHAPQLFPGARIVAHRGHCRRADQLLSAVDLDITAVPGPGNLLGNLLCAVAGLLDGGGPLAGIQNLLDRITGLLGGLLG